MINYIYNQIHYIQRWAYDTVGLGDLLYFIYTYYLDSNFDFSILYSSVVIAPSSNKVFNVTWRTRQDLNL